MGWRAPVVTARCRVTVAGQLCGAAAGTIRAQYDDAVISIQRIDSATVLDLDGLDQSALRGLLTLLWDFGHDVVAVSQPTQGPATHPG